MEPANERGDGRIRDRPPGFVAGNYFDKYETRNPLYRNLVERFLGCCRELLAPLHPARLLEVGCGAGELTRHLIATMPWSESPQYLGIDLGVGEIVEASALSRERSFLPASVYRLPFPDASFDCVVACELFEHLEDPRTALDEVERVCAGHLLLSVPWEPIWRFLNIARGRYLSDLGNTPGHLQHFSRAAIRALVASRFEVIAERRPLPWTVLLARPTSSQRMV